MRYLSILFIFFITSCTVAKKSFDPGKKFSSQQLKQDFDLYQNILQERHPSLYWYTSKPLMNKAFSEGKNQLTDSLTEYDFRKVLALVNSKIQCGHTSIRPSKQYQKFVDTLKSRTSFPLYLKIWNDTTVVTYNSYKNDSILIRGMMLHSVNGKHVKELIDTMYHYINADGNNTVAKNQILSTGTMFGSLFTSLYGLKKEYDIAYLDTTGKLFNTKLKPIISRVDSSKSKSSATLSKPKKPSKKEVLKNARSLSVSIFDSTALMELNSFSEKLRLKRFFRKSFRRLKQENIKSLIIDLRSNSGGRIDNSNSLTRYLVDKPFKLADSLYAKTRRSDYSKYIKNDFWSKLAMQFFTRKKAPGQYHFVYYEQHYFKPRKRNRFEGNVYILSGGNSFSASTLVMNVVKPQHNITIVGEPSGGAGYGNTAWFINEVTLPNTNVRFRLPLFRLVIDKNLPKDGQGVLPEEFAGPTIDAIIKERDYKMQKAKELIREKR